MMYKLLAVTMAASVDEILRAGKTIGTSNNQAILGMLVVSLIVVVGYREWQQVRANREVLRRHDNAMMKADAQHLDLVNRLEKERTSSEEERRERIAMLMTLVTDNTKAMERSAMAQSAVAEAVGVNSTAVNALRDLIYDMRGEGSTKRRG